MVQADERIRTVKGQAAAKDIRLLFNLSKIRKSIRQKSHNNDSKGIKTEGANKEPWGAL